MNLSQFAKIDLRQKPNKREKLIFILATAALILGFTKACVIASQQAISDIKKQIAEKETELAKLVNSEPKAETSEKPKEEGTKTNWLGSPKAIEKAVEQLARSDATRGIRLVKSRFVDQKPDPKKPQPFTKKTTQIEIAGDFANIGQYIQYLEALPAPLVIDQLTVEPSESDPGILTASIQGGFYASK